jgi:nitrogen fixation protein FixH
LNGDKVYTTDNEGQIKASTEGLAPNTYIAEITFNGTANYAKTTKAVKVTVKKATPKMTAKAKTFKKSVKTKKYSITLKTNQNKVMKNTKVTIKVNKKTYTAKTNSKGVATFKITKLTKKGKYTATVTYKGDSCYNKLTKKVKITVK